jgi:hypothetical protein
VRILRQVANLAPVVSAVQFEASPKPGNRGQDAGPLAYRMIKIDASDPNQDELSLTIAFRELGERLWVTLVEDLDKPAYVWDTRTVGDGTYELRVTASDAPANPPASALTAARISAPIVVDNTAPVVGELSAEPADAAVAVSGRAVDAGSRIAAIHYAVDSAEEWTAVLPADGICDADAERFAFDLSDVSPGPHRVAVRVTDIYGNAGYGNLTVTVGD